MASVAGIFRVKLLKTEGTYKLTQMCQTKPDPRKSSSLHDKGTEENKENKSQGNFLIPRVQTNYITTTF